MELRRCKKSAIFFLKNTKKKVDKTKHQKYKTDVFETYKWKHMFDFTYY